METESSPWGFPENMKSTLQCSICIFPGDRWPVMPEILILQLYHGITTLPTVCKGIHFLPLVGSLLWERLWNHFGSQQNMKRKGNIFKAANVKSLEHLLAGQWVKKTQMEKSQSVYALVWSPMFSPVFFFLFSNPPQRSALRIHTCSATMIHIITTCGDDSNQKVKGAQQIIWRALTAREIFTEYSCGRASKNTLYRLQFWEDRHASLSAAGP